MNNNNNKKKKQSHKSKKINHIYYENQTNLSGENNLRGKAERYDVALARPWTLLSHIM